MGMAEGVSIIQLYEPLQALYVRVQRQNPDLIEFCCYESRVVPVVYFRVIQRIQFINCVCFGGGDHMEKRICKVQKNPKPLQKRQGPSYLRNPWNLAIGN